MGASAFAAVTAIWLVLAQASGCVQLLDTLSELLQRNPVVVECSYE